MVKHFYPLFCFAPLLLPCPSKLSQGSDAAHFENHWSRLIRRNQTNLSTDSCLLNKPTENLASKFDTNI